MNPVVAALPFTCPDRIVLIYAEDLNICKRDVPGIISLYKGMIERYRSGPGGYSKLEFPVLVRLD